MNRDIEDTVSELIELKDWLEFKRLDGRYVNISRSQVEYVAERLSGAPCTELGLKSGNKIVVDEKYEKVVEMV